MSQSDGQTLELDPTGGVVRFRVLMLDPLTATDLLADIVGILGPALAALSGASGERDALAEALGSDPASATLSPGSSVAVERAAVSFFARFSKVQQRQLIEAMSKVSFATVRGENDAEKEVQLSTAGAMSLVFRGRISLLYRWLGFALKVQYSDFFTAAGAALGPVLAKMGLGK